MAEKILFSDMDGTLLTSDKRVSPLLQKLLTRLVENGHQLVLTSGRAPGSIIKTAGRAGLLFPDTLFIAANGNLVYDYASGQTLLEKTVPENIARSVIEMARRCGVHIQSYNDTHVICEKENEELSYYKRATGMESIITHDIMAALGRPPLKLLAIDLSDKQKLHRLRQQVLKAHGDIVTAMFSCDEYLEIFDKTAGKGNAVRFVCDYLNIPVEHSVAAGDAENDISMLDAAGIAVVMANADDKVKEHADFITINDNDHDGLAEAIVKYFE